MGQPYPSLKPTSAEIGWSNPKDAVYRSPLERNGWAALAPIGEQGIENVPVRVPQLPDSMLPP